MTEYIKRDKALDPSNILQVHTKEYGSIEVVPVECLAEIPTADVTPIRYGEWAHLGGDEWCCTNCGEVITTEGSWEKPTRKYCSECGVKMKGELK